MAVVEVTGQSPYAVNIGRGNLGQAAQRVAQVGARRALVVHQAPADPLELAADGDLSRVEVHVLPRQTQHLAPAEAQHQDPDTSKGGSGDKSKDIWRHACAHQ